MAGEREEQLKYLHLKINYNKSGAVATTTAS